MTTPESRLKELRSKAEKATPGPWKYEEDQNGTEFGSDDERIGVLGRVFIGNNELMDAAFIAAANPATVIELLDTIEVMREQVRVARKGLEAAKKHCLCGRHENGFNYGGDHQNLGKHPRAGARWCTPDEIVDAYLAEFDACLAKIGGMR